MTVFLANQMKNTAAGLPIQNDGVVSFEISNFVLFFNFFYLLTESNLYMGNVFSKESCTGI